MAYSPIITLAELNTVYQDLRNRINIAPVYNFKGQISYTDMVGGKSSAFNKDTDGYINIGDVYEVTVNTSEESDASVIGIQNGDNIVAIQKFIPTAVNTNDKRKNSYWGNYWIEIGSYMELADDTHNGLMSTTTQTFAGDKTFTGNVTVTPGTLTTGENTALTVAVLKVNGDGTINNTLTANGTVTVSNETKVGGTLNVSGDITSASLLAQNDSGVYQEIKSKGTVTCNTISSIVKNSTVADDYPELLISGNISASSLSVNGGSSSLNTKGTVTCNTIDALNSNYPELLVSGNISASSLTMLNGSTYQALNTKGTVTCNTISALNSNYPELLISGEIKAASLTMLNDSGTYQALNTKGTVTCNTIDALNSNYPELKISGNIEAASLTTTGNLKVNSDVIAASITEKKSYSITNTSTTTISVICSTLILNDGTNNKALIVQSDVKAYSISDCKKIVNSSDVTCSTLTLNDGTNNKALTVQSDVKAYSISDGKKIVNSSDVTCSTLTLNDGTNNKALTISNDQIVSSVSNTSAVTCSTVNCGTLNLGTSQDGTLTVGTLKVGTTSGYVTWTYSSGSSDPISSHAAGSGTIKYDQNMSIQGHLWGYKIHNAVWNDLVDCIQVDEDLNLEYGRCYCFDGKKYYLSNKHNESGFIGIHSDTAGFMMGEKPCKTLNVSVSGFVLAYVDKCYTSGTPLVCGKNGTLTKATIFDRLFKPYTIVGTFWKEEVNDYWGPKDNQIHVNGRHWIKIK